MLKQHYLHPSATQLLIFIDNLNVLSTVNINATFLFIYYFVSSCEEWLEREEKRREEFLREVACL